MKFPCRLILLLTLLSSAACGQGRGPYPERLPIGAVQGRVEARDSGARHRSPMVGETVTVRGVVHQLLRWRASEGHFLYGVMIQDLPGDADGDTLTSDGIFVYTGGSLSLRRAEQGMEALGVGDIVVLRGLVQERFNQTELAEAVVLEIRRGGDLNRLLPPMPLTLSADRSETERILERHEGMRVILRPGAVSISGTFPNPRNDDYMVWITPAENPVLKREHASERRLFRGAHPLSDVPAERRLQGHGMRLNLGSLAMRGRAGPQADPSLPPLKTGTVFPDALLGGVHFAFGAYVLQLEEMPRWMGGENPSAWRLPVPEGSENRVRIVTYNIENLYDFINDPFSDCDFEGDPGCRRTRFPLNYVPASDEEFRVRLRGIARQIVEELDSPPIIMVQEIENQDIGVLTPGGMVYGKENNADGELDALQELAIEIAALGGPIYTSATNRQGGDERGIICAFLYQADVFQPVQPEADHPILGANPRIPVEGEAFPMVGEVANPKTFNYLYEGHPDSDPGLPGVFSRAVQVFALRQNEAPHRTLWLLNNHFTSGPDRSVERRTEQARVNAALARHIMELFPEDGVIVGGDLNQFPRPDDPHSPPSDQLGPLYRAGLFNVYDDIIARNAANAYSYLFQGDANTLDHLFLSPNLKEVLRYASFLHLNADHPEAPSGALPLRGSDHDPLVIEIELSR